MHKLKIVDKFFTEEHEADYYRAKSLVAKLEDFELMLLSDCDTFGGGFLEYVQERKKTFLKEISGNEKDIIKQYDLVYNCNLEETCKLQLTYIILENIDLDLKNNIYARELYSLIKANDFELEEI